MDNYTKRALINEFVNRSFRDVADMDYITARVVHRKGLAQQFLWAALQALEKYLKAILLYNDKNTKGIRHSVYDAYEKVLLIKDINFDFPKDVENFIKYIDAQGANRYFEYPYYTMGEELLSLDKAVWYVRRYCFYLRLKTYIRKEEISLLDSNIKKIQHPYTIKYPNKYSLFGGYLEKVLSKKDSILRKNLVWKNFYYGTYKKKIIKRYTFRSVSGNPTHYMTPEIFSELSKRVQFSKEIIEYFAGLNKKAANNSVE